MAAAQKKISCFVDHFLKKYVENILSYIRDSTDFINILMQVNPTPNNLLVTIDVTSLYNTIHNVDALRAAKNTLELHRPNDSLPTTMDIVRLLALVLRCNNF